MEENHITEREPEIRATAATSIGQTAAIAPEREERLFLLLSIVIGIISGTDGAFASMSEAEHMARLQASA